MKQREVKSKMPGRGREVPNEVCRRLGALAEAARSCLAWHSNRMGVDAEYHAAVRYVTMQLAERPGPLGHAVRRAEAIHALLIKAL